MPSSPAEDSVRPRPFNGYSADVRLFLILADGTRLRPAQVGHEFVILREPVLLSAGPAVVEIVVDGRPHRWDVTIAPRPDADTCVPITDRNGRH